MEDPRNPAIPATFMKIETVYREIPVFFSALAPGDVFSFAGEYYLKLTFPNDCRAVNLATYDLCCFNHNCEAVPYRESRIIIA